MKKNNKLPTWAVLTIVGFAVIYTLSIMFTSFIVFIAMLFS